MQWYEVEWMEYFNISQLKTLSAAPEAALLCSDFEN